MLLPMMLADRKRAWQLAGWCALWSVIGGMAGYAIGALFWDTAGIWIINMLHIPLSRVETIRQEYAANAYLIAVQGLTPIPFKLVTISAGLANVPFASSRDCLFTGSATRPRPYSTSTWRSPS
jgi:membrane protein YqaA with SNARE-associated domain